MEEQKRNITTADVTQEYEKICDNLKTLQGQLRDQNEELQRTKQAVLIATGAKVGLGKVLGLNA
jgi:Cdc6-like AAA superfamily ATPase